MTATDATATDASSESDADLTAAGVTWDLETLLDGAETPDFLLEEADALASSLEVHRGSVATMDAARLAEVMQTMARISELISRAGHYGGLKFAENTQDAQAAALMQRLEERSTAIGSKLMFVELEFASATDEHADAVLADDRLGFCRHHLENTRRNRPYLLTEPEEAILLETSVSGPSAWVRLFSELTSVIEVEPTWAAHTDGPDTDDPDADSDVETVGLEQGLSMLQHPSRETRAAAAQAITDGLAPGLKTRAFVFNTLLLDKSIRDRLRSYPTWITSRNVSNEASDESVQALVEAVVSRYDIPQRWYRLKARAMGVDKLADFDRMAPMADTSQEVGWAEATAIVRDSYRSFSPELADIVDRFIDEQWIDAPIRPGKQPGAFCAYSVPSHHPYVLLNWASKTRDVLTLAHELGHGIHGYLAREQGIFHQSTPLTLAETASVFGETVTNNRLLGMIDDPAERFALLASVVDDSVATVFRQVAMNRFEDACHTERRTVGELSVDRFGELWIGTQADMMGDSVELTDNYTSWWSYIPHFIGSPGYVYAYAYGQLLALSVYARYTEQGDAFVPAYLDLLRAGGSMSPEDLGAIVDCDLADPSFWVAGLDIVEHQLAKTEEAAEAAGVV